MSKREEELQSVKGHLQEEDARRADVEELEELRRTKARLLELEARRGAEIRELRDQLKNANTAVTISQAQSARLKANIGVLRAQRDSAIEREADAMVNGELRADDLQAQHKKHARSLQDQIEQLQEEKATPSDFNRMSRNLTELRSKLASLTSDKKMMVKDIENRANSFKSLLRDYEELESALTWFAHINSTKQGLAFRFERKTDRRLTAEDILHFFQHHCEDNDGEPDFARIPDLDQQLAEHHLAHWPYKDVADEE